MIKIKFLAENKTNNPGYIAEHGLSIYIETQDYNLLFDTGASDMFMSNAHKMGINLAAVDALIISHGHYDHTGGVPAFCEANKKAPVCIHHNAFRQTYGISNGELESVTSGIRWTKREHKRILSRLLLTKGMINIGSNIWISGTIPDVEGAIAPETFYEKDSEGKLIPDDMSHEQFLAVRNVGDDGESLGIYIFSGCSHKGVIPVIKYAKELFPDERIVGLIAGMHLYSADAQTIERVTDEVANLGLDMVMPVHCTGINGICALKTKMGDACIPATCGDEYEF